MRLRITVRLPVAVVNTDSARKAYERVLENAGAKPVRDAVDARIVDEVKTGRGRNINSQEEVGGWPRYQPGKWTADAIDSVIRNGQGIGIVGNLQAGAVRRHIGLSVATWSPQPPLCLPMAADTSLRHCCF